VVDAVERHEILGAGRLRGDDGLRAHGTSQFEVRPFMIPLSMCPLKRHSLQNSAIIVR